MALFNKHDLQRIAVALERAEHGTSARVEVVSVNSSSRYNYFRMLGAAMITLVVSALIFLLLNQFQNQQWNVLEVDAARWVWWSQFPVLLIAWWLCGFNALLRRIVPTQVRRATVGDKAQLTYLEMNPINAQPKPSVLIYISSMERRVELLASPDVEALLGGQVWQRHIAMLIGAIHDQQATDGMCNVLEALAVQLANVLPAVATTATDLDKFNHEFRNDAA